MELRITSNVTVMKYAGKLTKLSTFVPKFVSFERIKTRRFEKGLVL